MARTDWQYDEVVTETDFNELGQEINENAADIAHLQDELSAAAAVPVTIPQGVSIVHSGRKSRFKDMRIGGRTLVNLLGRDGNCESTSVLPPLPSDVTLSLDTTNKVYGNNGIKFTVVRTVDGGVLFNSPDESLLTDGGYYIYLVELKNGNLEGGLQAEVYLDEARYYAPLITSTSGFSLSHVKFQYNGETNLACEVWWGGSNQNNSGNYGYIDGARLYEITEDEYDALETMTADEIAAMYPYVDDMKHVNAVYVRNPGKNLFAPATKCSAFSGTAWNVNAPYNVTDVKPTSGDYDIFGFYSTVIPGQIYTISSLVDSVGATGSGGYLDVQLVADDGTPSAGTESSKLQNGTLQVTYTIPNGIHRVRVSLVVHGDTTGTFTFSNFQMNIGSAALPFEPQQPSYMYLPDCNLRANVGDSVRDELYMDGEGKPRVVRRYWEMVLDGSLPWTLSTPDFTGYKQVICPHTSFGGIPANTTNLTGIKYDGKVLKSVNTQTGGDEIFSGGSNLAILISDTDSGWGDSYTTPTADEIKAYFYGWRMGDGLGAPYTGSGNKYWYNLVDSSLFSSTPDVPPTIIAAGYSPYRLMYQLAQSVDEPVTYEGALMLYDGPNQIEMGTGIVVWEAANPQGNASYMELNVVAYAGSMFTYRTASIFSLYRDTEKDDWKIDQGSSPYGKYRAFIETNRFDPSAAYSVTYLALDKYLLGIAPSSITGAVTANIKETVDDAVEAISGLRRDVLVMQNVKSDKQQPQVIAATLLNSWVGFSSSYPSFEYYNGEQDTVHFEAVIKSGVTAQGTTIMVFPHGYRPKTTIRAFPATTHDGTEAYGTVLDLFPDGQFKISSGAVYNTWLVVRGSFRAEQ